MFGSELWIEWLKYFDKIIGPTIFSTIRMVSTLVVFYSIIRFGLAILLILYGSQGLRPREKFCNVLDFMVNSMEKKHY
ncbi:MAG: metP [Firmicutes bacterium]|nr:metP [Bacillota bacterium]